MSKLLELYEGLLNLSGLIADKDGYISVINDKDNPLPLIIKNKRVVLPTEFHLKNSNPDEKLLFSPIPESVFKGPSDVLERYKDCINIRLNIVTGTLFSYLLAISKNNEIHSKLDPEHLDLLIALKDIDDTAIKNFTSLMLSGVENRIKKFFVNIYLNRGGVVKEKKWARVGIVTFPLYEELKKDENIVYGIKLRNKDKLLYKKLYEYVFPFINEKFYYSEGSQSEIAPWLDSLVKTTLSIYTNITDNINKFRLFIDEPDSMLYDESFVSLFMDLNKLKSDFITIPIQLGNEGKNEQEETSVYKQELLNNVVVGNNKLKSVTTPFQKINQNQIIQPIKTNNSNNTSNDKISIKDLFLNTQYSQRTPPSFNSGLGHNSFNNAIRPVSGIYQR